VSPEASYGEKALKGHSEYLQSDLRGFVGLANYHALQTIVESRSCQSSNGAMNFPRENSTVRQQAVTDSGSKLVLRKRQADVETPRNSSDTL
jgi:hypothetical protein